MPPHTRFVGCTDLPNQQGKPLRAVYRVSGAFATSAEAYLVKAAGLNRLRRSCCQWDSPPGHFRDASGREFSITMASEETPVRARAGWRKIGRFEITVETLTEEI